MKKLLVSLMALVATLSMGALEKPGYDTVDYDTYRIEKIRGENPEVHILHRKLKELRARAKTETGRTLENVQALIKEYEAAIEAKLK